jgi:plasmid maintenance system antidote protein VapI
MLVEYQVQETTMSKMTDYLESVRELTAKKSWYAVAHLLETDEANISRIRRGQKNASNEICFRIAELLELEPSEVIAVVEMEAAKDEEKKEFWKNHFFQHGRVALIAIAAFCTTTFYSDQAKASEITASNKSFHAGHIIAHYAKFVGFLKKLLAPPRRNVRQFHFRPAVHA